MAIPPERVLLLGWEALRELGAQDKGWGPVSTAAWERIPDLGWLQASLPLLAQGCVISFVCSLLGLCPNLLSHVEYGWTPSLWLGKSSPVRLQTQLHDQLEMRSQEAQAPARSAPSSQPAGTLPSPGSGFAGNQSVLLP